MRPHKHSDAKAAAKQHEITPGRVSHSPSEEKSACKATRTDLIQEVAASTTNDRRSSSRLRGLQHVDAGGRPFPV